MPENKKNVILVTNDDGINAKGIRTLVFVAQKFGEVVVVAPDSPQSAKGHAITIATPVRINKVELFEGVESYECSGTPVDCVKLAKNVLLKDRNIIFCLSGINHGSNASINIIYSGTLSAAMEAALEGIPSIGFSLLDYAADADFGAAAYFAEKIIAQMVQHKWHETHLLNVNFPSLPQTAIKGIRVCRQADARWVEDYWEAKDPYGQPYYWLTGKFITEDLSDDTDLWALENGYISVVPSTHDLTDYRRIAPLKYVEKSV
ncbi:MAG: 5'/3'-nucleotidase SurE [Saprospiraceae bacterium]|nr:5'/3'-nucleotidase SurE [Saprospiraceae bacterium]MBP7699779.1 5'/3'-nucleotidase SurE [Saprospiraceae bacterium]